MKKELTNKKLTLLLSAGLLGTVLMALGDFLMIYGNTAYSGNLAWLTEGVKTIPAWRNTFAMAVALPAVILYIIGLLALKNYIVSPKAKKIYLTLTTVGMTPWLMLHLLYTMILFAFSWLNQKGESKLALDLCEALFSHFSWLVFASQALMLLPFIALLVITLMKKSVFPKLFFLNNPLFIYVVLKLITGFMPDVPFRLAFVNGLMSESMFIWFILIIVFGAKYRKLEK